MVASLIRSKKKMARLWKNVLVLIGCLFIPLFYTALLEFNISSRHSSATTDTGKSARWPIPPNHLLDSSTRQPSPQPSPQQGMSGNHNQSSDSNDRLDIDNEREHMMISLRRLVRGRALEELRENGISCVSELQSILCVTTGSVRITTGAQPMVYLSDRQNLTNGNNFSMKPYPKRKDEAAMMKAMTVTIASPDESNIPVCDVFHVDPAMVISTGGYSENFFHTINDVMIPLFLSTKHFQSQIEFVINDHKPLWMEKYANFFKRLSAHDIVVASSRVVPVDTRVHCFPGAMVGVKYHDFITINPSEAPGDVNMMDFKHFLHQSFSLRNAHVTSAVAGKKPIMVLICRRRSRTLRNENQVAHLARKLGFHVELAPPSRMKKTLEFAELVNSCSVMVGVLGAGLTNMVFLPKDAMVVQIVPFALDWDAKTCYGKEPASRFGLKYLEYQVKLEESSIYKQYSKDDPVIADPESIKRQGYRVFKAVYLDGNNVTVDISKFRKTLLQAKKLLPHTFQVPLTQS